MCKHVLHVKNWSSQRIAENTFLIFAIKSLPFLALSSSFLSINKHRGDSGKKGKTDNWKTVGTTVKASKRGQRNSVPRISFKLKT